MFAKWVEQSTCWINQAAATILAFRVGLSLTLSNVVIPYDNASRSQLQRMSSSAVQLTEGRCHVVSLVSTWYQYGVPSSS